MNITLTTFTNGKSSQRRWAFPPSGKTPIEPYWTLFPYLGRADQLKASSIKSSRVLLSSSSARSQEDFITWGAGWLTDCKECHCHYASLPVALDIYMGKVIHSRPGTWSTWSHLNYPHSDGGNPCTNTKGPGSITLKEETNCVWNGGNQKICWQCHGTLYWNFHI